MGDRGRELTHGRDAVGVRQLHLHLADGHFGALTLGHIYSSTNKLDELAVFIENRMTRGIDMPNCSVWQKNPVLGEGINSFAKRLLKSLLYPIAILGVDLLPKIVSRRQALPWIQSENSEHFLGAVQHLFGAGIPNPTAGVGQLLRFGQISRTSRQSLFGALALGQVAHESDTLVSFFAERSQTDQHGHASPIFPKVLLLEWLDCPDPLQLCISPRVVLAPFRRRQVRSVQAARDKILSIVSPHAEKRVICLKNATFEIPDDDPDDVGVDQTPNLCFVLFELAVQCC